MLAGFSTWSFCTTGPAVLAPIVVGGGTLAAILLMFLPRTNARTARSAEALALLTIGLYFAGSAIFGGYGFVNGLVMSASWHDISGGLALLIVHGVVGFLALTRLGALAGWTPPVRAVPPPPYPPPGYPPEGGYPPQGGYPPGGGYPPQGGGYPPQGGGGGGYPPHGPQGPQGGGYPPPGGGYPR